MSMEIFIGMIASGKSTLARERAEEGAIVVNDDAIVTAVHGGDYTLYDKSLKPLYKTIEQTTIMTAIAMSRDVVIDRTCLNPSMRAFYIGIAKRLDVEVAGVVFPMSSPEEHARRRFESDSRGHTFEKWLKIARHHASVYAPPSADEGILSITHLWPPKCNTPG